MNMKKVISCLLLSAGLLVPASTLAKDKTVEHPSCIVYLPLTKSVNNWGTWRQDFVDRGYSPVEFDGSQAADLIRADDLVAELHYRFSSETTWLGTTKQLCTVELTLSKFITFKPSPLAAILYTKKVTETTFLGNSVECQSAEAAVLAGFPTCLKQ